MFASYVTRTFPRETTGRERISRWEHCHAGFCQIVFRKIPLMHLLRERVGPGRNDEDKAKLQETLTCPRFSPPLSFSLRLHRRMIDH